jgi:hypothetical protein
MGKPYSEDLRARVVVAEQDGAKIPETGERFGVSISSVVRFRRLHRETGSVSPANSAGTKDPGPLMWQGRIVRSGRLPTRPLPLIRSTAPHAGLNTREWYLSWPAGRTASRVSASSFPRKGPEDS